MKFLISSLLAVVLVAVNAPVAHAQSDILASATRLASTVELEQESGSVVRRMRSTTLTLLGVGALALGAVFAILPPDCDYTGGGDPSDGPIVYSYDSVHREGGCDVAVDIRIDRDKIEGELRRFPFIGLPTDVFFDREGEIAALKTHRGSYRFLGEGSIREYRNDVVNRGEGFVAYPALFGDIQITRSDARRKLGIGVAIGGAIALISGLWRVERELRESVDVPFRVGVTPDGGVLATRSIRW